VEKKGRQYWPSSSIKKDGEKKNQRDVPKKAHACPKGVKKARTLPGAAEALLPFCEEKEVLRSPQGIGIFTDLKKSF